MAGRVHHHWRIVKPGRRLCLRAWAVCAIAITASALRGQEDADSVPPVRLLYGTRRVRIDVPRRLLQPAARPVEPWPVPRRPILPSAPLLPSDPPLFSRPPSPPIDEGDRPPVDEPLVRSRLGAWQPVPVQEGPADGDVLPPDDAEAESGPGVASAPARDDDAVPPDATLPDDGPETSASPAPTPAPVRPDESTAATTLAGRSPLAAAGEPPIPQQRMERPDRSPRNEGWLIATLSPALGTTVGVMLGILFSTLLTFLLLRRFPGQLDRVVRVELINGFPSAPQWGAGPPPTASADARFPLPGGPEFAATEFGEMILPLDAAGLSAEDQRQAALQHQQLAEAAVLKSIYEDNVELRECLAAMARTA